MLYVRYIGGPLDGQDVLYGVEPCVGELVNVPVKPLFPLNVPVTFLRGTYQFDVYRIARSCGGTFAAEWQSRDEIRENTRICHDFRGSPLPPTDPK